MEKFIRNCSGCNKVLSYVNKYNRDMAEEKKSICRQCDDKKRSLRMKDRGNHFYGKKHSEETILKMEKSQKSKDQSFCQTKEFKDKSRRPGKLNGMYGRRVYDVWIEKYGETEANKKMIEYKKRKSIETSGINNPMYGKPTPQGSGNGWSGWYKGWYFRSLRELSYMINVIEVNQYQWRTAETNDLKIRYVDYDETERTYRADFFINEKILVEVKPYKLFDTPNNSLKKKAAIEFCLKHGFEYRMVDVKLLDMNLMISLYKNKEIKFIEKYQKLMENMLWKLMKKE